jgi:hypothetical protein
MRPPAPVILEGRGTAEGGGGEASGWSLRRGCGLAAQVGFFTPLGYRTSLIIPLVISFAHYTSDMLLACLLLVTTFWLLTPRL